MNQNIWNKRLQGNGMYAVALINTTDTTATITFNWSTIGLTTVSTLRDLWQKQNIQPNGNAYSVSVSLHGTVLLKVTGQ